MSELKKSKTSRRLVYLIGFVFFMPYFCATALYFSGYFKYKSNIAHGHLLKPPQHIQGLFTQQGKALLAADLHHKWTLVLLNEGPCTSVCQTTFKKIRQVYYALDKKSQRVQTILGLKNKPSSTLDKRVTVWQYNPTHFKKQFTYPDTVLIIDPLGNIPMTYPASIAKRDLFRDLKQLLSVSRIG